MGGSADQGRHVHFVECDGFFDMSEKRIVPFRMGADEMVTGTTILERPIQAEKPKRPGPASKLSPGKSCCPASLCYATQAHTSETAPTRYVVSSDVTGRPQDIVLDRRYESSKTIKRVNRRHDRADDLPQALIVFDQTERLRPGRQTVEGFDRGYRKESTRRITGVSDVAHVRDRLGQPVGRRAGKETGYAINLRFHDQSTKPALSGLQHSLVSREPWEA